MARVPLSPITEPPIPASMLDRLALRWRRQSLSSGAGAHLRRRQGHSLEFREYRQWQRGEDIRAVDWRASLRQARQGDLLVRRFEAEEQMTLVIMLDTRPEMTLPEAMPKLLYGLWAVGALAMLALNKGDKVILARLFEGAAEPILSLSGPSGAKVLAWTEAQWAACRGDYDGTPPRGQGRAGRAAHAVAAVPTFADLDALVRRIEPASAVVLISDMLFEDPDGIFTTFARRAQQRQRSLSILQLDSLAHETALMRAAQHFQLVRRNESVAEGLSAFDEGIFAEAGSAVGSYLAQLRSRIGGAGLDWPSRPISWPSAAVESDQAAGALRSFFTQSFPHLPLLSELSLGGGR